MLQYNGTQCSWLTACVYYVWCMRLLYGDRDEYSSCSSRSKSPTSTT